MKGEISVTGTSTAYSVSQCSAFKRISKELGSRIIRDGDVSTEDGISLKIVGDAWDHLDGWFEGPSDTPYAGGTFHMDIKLPPTFPFAPPKVKFVTPIWHPNISPSTGEMCLEFLRDWGASMSVRKLLLFIQSLLTNPDVSPWDVTHGNENGMSQFLFDRNIFDTTVKYWTSTYASEGKLPVDQELQSKVNNFLEMTGCSLKSAQLCMSSADWVIKTAIDALSYPPGSSAPPLYQMPLPAPANPEPSSGTFADPWASHVAARAMSPLFSETSQQAPPLHENGLGDGGMNPQAFEWNVVDVGGAIQALRSPPGSVESDGDERNLSDLECYDRLDDSSDESRSSI